MNVSVCINFDFVLRLRLSLFYCWRYMIHRFYAMYCLMSDDNFLYASQRQTDDSTVTVHCPSLPDIFIGISTGTGSDSAGGVRLLSRNSRLVRSLSGLTDSRSAIRTFFRWEINCGFGLRHLIVLIWNIFHQTSSGEGKLSFLALELKIIYEIQNSFSGKK